MAAAPDTTSDSGSEGYTLPETLRRFASSPTGFILGAILSPLLRGLNNVVVTILDLITFVFQGSGPGLVGTLGLVDIPLFIGTELVEAGAIIGGSSVEGTGLLGVVSTVIDAGAAFASIGGPLAPVILAGEVVVVAYVFAFVTERIVLVIADAVPGLAGILGT
ncbi:hypothetical protein [Halorubrum tropicale]|uniref:Uncharacterized protein n=1 Tax=Halorubrum tropicale TaxID=1765655 RepID=A0A0M9ASK4_9EURY|nr:hypothetical protein [Halorubrum tropicale]KOX96945.1 hypothetical protein AMR74_05825 [Halorubrum tropicale]